MSFRPGAVALGGKKRRGSVLLEHDAFLSGYSSIRFLIRSPSEVRLSFIRTSTTTTTKHGPASSSSDASLSYTNLTYSHNIIPFSPFISHILSSPRQSTRNDKPVHWHDTPLQHPHASRTKRACHVDIIPIVRR